MNSERSPGPLAYRPTFPRSSPRARGIEFQGRLSIADAPKCRNGWSREGRPRGGQVS